MLSGIAIIHFDDMQKIHPFTYFGKIKSFVSEHQAKQLQRQVYINDRVKTMNESVYYNVDDIHTAINENKKIKFKYYKWDINKKLVPRHNGDWFVVSPWALTWDDENYYMVAFDDLDQQIKHYRVDKMMRLSVEEEKRAGKDAFKNFDMAEYSKSTFGMYQGKKTRVKIEFANYMCGVFIDRFDKDMYAAGVKTVVFVERRESFKSILSYLDYFLKKMNIGYKKNNLFVGSSEKMEKHYEDDIFRIFNFELYMYSALSRICETSFEIVEGKVTDDNKIILRKLSENTEFNLQQYEVEHATTEKNILVEAGAGTGKTFSMVSRVAFLCNKELDPVMNIADEIAMVTFTNDAAINMKKRLKQMFINYFVLTGSEKYLKYVEDIDRAQISTIHKFAIGILRGESLYTGLGTNFRISSNEYKRGKAYDIFLGEFLEEMEEKNSNLVNELPVPIYDLKKKLMSIADKLFAKSINLEQIKPAEMGVTVDNNIPYFNELLTRVVFPAEATYIESMKNSNDVDLKECLIELPD